MGREAPVLALSSFPVGKGWPQPALLTLRCGFFVPGLLCGRGPTNYIHPRRRVPNRTSRQVGLGGRRRQRGIVSRVRLVGGVSEVVFHALEQPLATSCTDIVIAGFWSVCAGVQGGNEEGWRSLVDCVPQDQRADRLCTYPEQREQVYAQTLSRFCTVSWRISVAKYLNGSLANTKCLCLSCFDSCYSLSRRVRMVLFRRVFSEVTLCMSGADGAPTSHSPVACGYCAGHDTPFCTARGWTALDRQVLADHHGSVLGDLEHNQHDQHQVATSRVQ